jgi:signal transduction histidine kinase
VPDIVTALKQNGQDYIGPEVDLGDAVYEQKICHLSEAGLIRIFSHDITALRRAEEAVLQMAEQLRGLARRVVLAQEEERRRVSRELHDEAGQALTALKISLELILESLPPDATEPIQNLAEAIALTHTTRQRIRLLAQGLHPPVLTTLGINLALEDLCRDFAKRTQIGIDYRGIEMPPQSDAIHLCLYRFLQEALTNVAEHAGAAQVWVTLDVHEAHIGLSVQDNGRGIDGGNETFWTKHTGGMGLLGMRERLQSLHGKLEIDSKQGIGTRVTARLPMGKTL